MLDPQILSEILLEARWDTLLDNAEKERGIVRYLMSRLFLFDQEPLLFWRTVEGLGKVVQRLDEKKPGYAVEIVRRYFWSLTEESGGTAWNASAAIGSIIAYCPQSCSHFNWMLSGLLEDESLQEGVLWGLLQMAEVSPALVDPLRERVSPFLASEDANQRALAMLIYLVMGRYNLFWQIPAPRCVSLRAEREKAMLYLHGEMNAKTISDFYNEFTPY